MPFGDELDVDADQVAHLERAHDAGLERAFGRDALALELLGVDRLLPEHARRAPRAERREEERQDHAVVARQLDDQHRREQRRVRHAGERRRHSEQGVGAGRRGRGREVEVRQALLANRADRRADEEHRREDAAGHRAADAERRSRRSWRRTGASSVCTPNERREDRPRGLVAVAVDLGNPDPDHADERAADHRPHGHRKRKPREQEPAQPDRRHEQDGEHAADHAERGVAPDTRGRSGRRTKGSS